MDLGDITLSNYGRTVTSIIPTSRHNLVKITTSDQRSQSPRHWQVFYPAVAVYVASYLCKLTRHSQRFLGCLGFFQQNPLTITSRQTESDCSPS